MYSNSEWTTNGFLILGVGSVTLFSGIAIWGYKKLVNKNLDSQPG
jgi:hypothetical protein